MKGKWLNAEAKVQQEREVHVIIIILSQEIKIKIKKSVQSMGILTNYYYRIIPELL